MDSTIRNFSKLDRPAYALTDEIQLNITSTISIRQDPYNSNTKLA